MHFRGPSNHVWKIGMIPDIDLAHLPEIEKAAGEPRALTGGAEVYGFYQDPQHTIPQLDEIGLMNFMVGIEEIQRKYALILST
ncbi:MAG TPA: hypothetical protein VLU38_05050, partial [Methanomassiliicoccales archaeon]|nr:hypothetical protein [Methanomassiliicoccales archaeon]